MLPADTFSTSVALVTTNSHLGHAMALEFARAGARVAIALGPLGMPASGNAEVDQRIQGFDFDPCSESSVRNAFSRIEETLGPVSLLLNNPTAMVMAAVETLDLVGWRAHTQPILDGAFVCSAEFARRRRQVGEGGAVLNLVEPVGPGGTGTGALINLTQTLAVEWAADDIRVNAIAPGLFEGDDSPALRQAARTGRNPAGTVPAMRLGQAHEFGWAATYLCSPYAAYITGAVFVIDGANCLRRGISGPPFTATREWAVEPG
jgi:NAD(P)-dependent dehydrogenase (short-subunit alcohol dehydrogenase family)